MRVDIQLLQEHLGSGRLNEVTCSPKSNLLLNNIPNNFWLELLVTVSFLIFNATLSSVFISR